MTTLYQACDQRYQQQPYRRSGQHGLRLPAIALGLWHNFGGVNSEVLSHAAATRLRSGHNPFRSGQ